LNIVKFSNKFVSLKFRLILKKHKMKLNKLPYKKMNIKNKLLLKK